MREIRNLVRNPKPANTSGWVLSHATAVFGDGMRLEGDSDNSYACCAITFMEPGDYVAVATLVNVYNDTGFAGDSCMSVGLYRNDGGIAYAPAPYAGTGCQYIVPFTVPEANTKRKADVILRTPLTGDAASNACRWARVGMFAADAWAAMQSAGIEWFDGDNYIVAPRSIDPILCRANRHLDLVVVA